MQIERDAKEERRRAEKKRVVGAEYERKSRLQEREEVEGEEGKGGGR